MRPEPFIETKQGVYQGERTSEYTIYRGIPYAKAPVGPLRFRAPEAPDSFSGVRKADSFAPRSIQPENDPESFYGKEFYAYPDYQTPEINEDCLYLNLWIPTGTPPEGGWPIVLWIHGGGFSGGWGSEIEFDGQAWTKRGVILVTCNYRLGLLGYFTHPDLSTEQGGHSGNYGLLDQIAALRWVYENAAALDGNPQRITLMGQSAGAASVQAMLCSPLCKDMVARAIIQSALNYKRGFIAPRTLSEQEDCFERLLDSERLTVQKLQQLPVQKILELQEKMMEAEMPLVQKTGVIPFGPVTSDGYVLPIESFHSAIEKNQMADIPILTGVTRKDIFVPEEAQLDPRKAKSYQDMLDFSAKRTAEHGAPCYAYFFQRALPGDEAGAFHSSELWYMFGTLRRCWRPFTAEDERISEAMLDAWTSFAKTGEPGGDWTACDGTGATVKIWDT